MKVPATLLNRRLSARALLTLAAFAVGFQVTANAPAALAAALLGGERAGLTVAKTSGTFWNGKLQDARLRGVALGDVSFSVRGLSLLTGAVAVDLRLEGGAATGSGRARASFGGLSVTDATFEFDLATARRYAFLGAPLEGRLRGVVREMKIAKGGCTAADIDLWTDVLAAPARRMRGAGMDLAGGASCADGSLIATLAGASGDGSVRLRLAVAPDMTYALDATAVPARADLGEALRAFGFTQSENGMTMAMSGVLRPGS